MRRRAHLPRSERPGQRCNVRPAYRLGRTSCAGAIRQRVIVLARTCRALQHELRLEGIEKISFSVWVAPTELSGYREIFRKEDGDDRVLFSFQDGGVCLSLGLNVGGYVECHAPMDRLQVLDGAGTTARRRSMASGCESTSTAGKSAGWNRPARSRPVVGRPASSGRVTVANVFRG